MPRPAQQELPLEHAIFLILAKTKRGPATPGGIVKAFNSLPRPDRPVLNSPMNVESVTNILIGNPHVFRSLPGGKWGIYPGLIHILQEHFQGHFPQVDVFGEIFNPTICYDEVAVKNLIVSRSHSVALSVFHMGRWPGAPLLGLAFDNYNMAENPKYLPLPSGSEWTEFKVVKVQSPGDASIYNHFTIKRELGGYWMTYGFASWVAACKCERIANGFALRINELNSTVVLPEKDEEGTTRPLFAAFGRQEIGRNWILEHLFFAANAQGVSVVSLNGPGWYGHPDDVAFDIFKSIAERNGYEVEERGKTNISTTFTARKVLS